ncbi:uncharacterized protein BO80DRAFT_442149 [Aspergillus ibericus CBS 121593]|uniref:Uncharacterized protein n=1 Tax=Aspergillus ibericus CBS 121593 TaxID=1448316 RepID=A0A395H8B3_9EURO|nr:hypothetical protein BO80DRAFT_442149 [Aspergillus ibericus CBS 121593]RAL04147.1 hypothetical protein BO80DRAFT_442149 [Aspergillus ibericus CBS 121593]
MGKKDEEYEFHREYYQLAGMLADDLDHLTLGWRFDLLWTLPYDDRLARDGRVRDLPKDSDDSPVLRDPPPTNLVDEYEEDWNELGTIWGKAQVESLELYGRWRMEACRALAEKEPNWDIVARWLNRAVLEQWTRQGQKQERGYGVQGCDILRVLAMDVPVAPVSEQELASINGVLDNVGLIRTCNSGAIHNWAYRGDYAPYS